MSKSEAKRQKQLAKKNKKAKIKHAVAVARKQQLSSLTGMMRAASRGEIMDCRRGYAGCAGEENGMIPVVLRRKTPDGAVALVYFLVDLWCLGVKDCSGRILSPQDSRKYLDHFEDRMDLQLCTAAEGKAIVDAGVAYAKSLGIGPHPDFPKIYPIWGDVQAASLPEEFKPGKDGRPIYVVGPYDDRTRQQVILNALRQSVGEGNFDWISPLDQFHSGSTFEGWDEIPEEVRAEIGLLEKQG